MSDDLKPPVITEPEELDIAPDMVSVIVIGKGTFGAEGIAKIGSQRDIPVAAFSKVWMKPRRGVDTQKLRKAGKL